MEKDQVKISKMLCENLEATSIVLKNKISVETKKQFDDLVRKTPEGEPEAGGIATLDDTKFMFFEAHNVAIDKIRDIENVDLRSPSALIYLNVVTTPSMGYEPRVCPLENSSDEWSKRIARLRGEYDNLNLNQGINETVYRDSLIRLRDELIKAYKDTYSAGKIQEQILGIKIARVHTHNNGTTFSNQDICNAREDESLEILVTHDYPTSKEYRILITCGYGEAKVGKYEIE